MTIHRRTWDHGQVIRDPIWDTTIEPQVWGIAELPLVLGTGSRSWRHPLLYDVLTSVMEEMGPFVLLHGGADGADDMMGQWASVQPVPSRLRWRIPQVVKPVPPEAWRQNRAAGHHRNQQMVDMGPVRCLGFLSPCLKMSCPQRLKGTVMHGSHGTEDCLRRARRAGIRTDVWHAPAP